MEKTEALKLLAIDDKPDNLTTLSAVVREVLPQTLVLTATNGRAGFELAAAEDPDVILLDIVMPGMDGFEVCRRLKADDRLKDIPVVFLTALKTDTASRVKALEVGGEGFLAKPLETAELTAQIRAMTKVKAANRSQRTEKERLEALVVERTRMVRESEERFRAANDASLDALLLLRSERNETGELSDFIFVELNRRTEEMLRMNREQLLGKRLCEALPINREAGFFDKYKRVVDTGIPLEEEFFQPETHVPAAWYYHQVVKVGDGIFICHRDITERKRAEAALADEAGRRRLLMEQSRDGIVILDQDGQVCESNRKFAEMLGYPHESMRQLNVRDWEFLHPPERLTEMLRSVDGKGNHFETRHRRKDGSTYDVEISTNAAWFAGQKLILCICRDMTDRKRSEEALRNAERNLRSTVDGLSAHIAVVDEHGEVILTNKSYHDFAKRNGAEPCAVSEGVNYLAVCDAASGEYSEESNPFAEGIRDVLSGKHPSFTLEYPCHSPDEKRWFIGRVTPFAGEGHRRVIVAHENITARKQAEQELVRLSTAIEQSAEVVVITDAQGTIQYVNPAFTQNTGYTREEALGQNPRILKSGMQDAEFYRRMWAALTSSEVFDCRMVNRRKDGTLYTEEATISPVKDASGRILNYVAVKRDITEHLREEEERAVLISQLNQAQKMESVGRLAGGVAHDFNNLLMGIMGYTELCHEQIAPDHPIRGFLDEIKTSAQRSAAITRQLLAFARKQTIAPRILDLNDAVGGMLKLLQRLIGEDVRLTWRPAADLPRVKLDPAQVDQILANLCVNARDAIAGVGEIVLETGSVVIGTDLCAQYPEAIPGAYVCLTVSDNGCGMDKETLAQVFEPFFTTKGVGEGTGLGLATVYGIVKQNNGFIYAYSEPGRDTTFRIILPAIAAEAEAPVTGETETPGGRWETVLVVEDAPSVRKMCRRFLEALGYKALEAETPEEALVIAKRYGGDIHLVLTDVVMPGMDGRQLAQCISAVKPGVKVLFMSGYTADVIAQRGVVDEGVQFLSKPFTRDNLARKVREVLEAD